MIEEVGMEDVDGKVTIHRKLHIAPLLVWAIITAAIFGLATDCDSQDGLYQGPNDEQPRYTKGF